MILQDFTYEWDGKSHDGKKPITWFPGAYRVRIVQIGENHGEVHFLFDKAVLLKPVPKKDAPYQSLTNYIHNFAERLSEEYGLDLHRTLWIEVREKVRIAHLNPNRKLSGRALLSFTWREARPHELDQIAPYTGDF